MTCTGVTATIAKLHNRLFAYAIFRIYISFTLVKNSNFNSIFLTNITQTRKSDKYRSLPVWALL